MEPREFRLLAEELCRQTRPASSRTAISRAYYYAFTSAVRFVGRYHSIPENAEAHGILPRLLKNSGNLDLRDIADDLDKLRAYRNEADYTLTASRPEKRTHAELCLRMAIQVVEDLVAVMADTATWNAAVATMKLREERIKNKAPGA